MARDTDKVEIAKADLQDAAKLAGISKRAFESDIEVGADKKGGPKGYDSVTAHRRHIESNYVEYIKILYGGEIVGGVRIFRADEFGQYDIWGLFVDPDYHRRAIASKALELVMKRYDDSKIWTLDTPKWNSRTKRFYEEKFGFQSKGILRCEQDFDLIYYELLVDDSYERPLKKIGNLEDGMQQLNVEAEVLSLGNIRKVYSKKDGKKHLVAEARISDETGEIDMVLWDNMIRQVRTGERIRAERAYTSVFRKELQLGVSRYGRIIILLT